MVYWNLELFPQCGICYFYFYFITVRRGFGPIKLVLTPPLFIEVSTPSQERLCICVLGVSIFPSLSTIFLMKFGTVLTVWYFFFHLISESLCLYKVVTVIWIMCRFLDWGYKWKVSLLFRNMENNIMFKGHSLFIIFSSTCHPPSTHTNIKKKKKKEEKKKDG